MALNVQRGQKTDLTKKYPGLAEVIIGLGWSAAQAGLEIDAAAFMLQKDGKCRDDQDFIFYGNPNGRGGAVTIQNTAPENQAQIKIDLKSVPADVDKIAFTLTIYDAVKRGHTFGQVAQTYINVTGGQEELIRFSLQQGFSSENAIVMAELYRHSGEWKFSPIAMGYQGGLAALCSGFGIEVSNAPQATPPPAAKQPTPTPAPKPTSAPTPRPTPMPTPPTPAPPPATAGTPPPGKIRLSKIELRKTGEKINLTKGANNKLGEITINLNWNQRSSEAKPAGLLGSLFGGLRGGAIDLDLGCLLEMRNGDKTAIQALGNSFGNYQGYPYIALDGDDRTGTVTTGENIRINGNHVAEFKRILVYAFIYEGVANWAEADGVVTIAQPGGPDIVVKLDQHDQRKNMCAIALIENVNNETFSIERSVRYFSGHREMDKAFNWGLQWQAGRK